MEKIKREVWTNLLGYNPGREVKEAILAEVAATGKSLQQVIGEGRTIPVLPETMILGDDGLFEYQGRRMTAKEFEIVNPLGKWCQLIIIGTEEMVQKHRKNCEL